MAPSLSFSPHQISFPASASPHIRHAVFFSTRASQATGTPVVTFHQCSTVDPTRGFHPFSLDRQRLPRTNIADPMATLACSSVHPTISQCGSQHSPLFEKVMVDVTPGCLRGESIASENSRLGLVHHVLIGRVDLCLVGSIENTPCVGVIYSKEHEPDSARPYLNKRSWPYST